MQQIRGGVQGYKTVSEVKGPLIVIKRTRNVAYGEIARWRGRTGSPGWCK